MVLTKQAIIERIEKKELSFSPSLDAFQLQPHAIDLRLGTHFYLAKTWEMTDEGRKAIQVDPFTGKNSDVFTEIILKPGQYFELLPQEYVVATTLEKLELNAPDLMAILYPRSSINRRGLAVDLSGIVDVGYQGKLMIPVTNNTEQQMIKIYPGERFCQIIIQTLSDAVPPETAHMHGLQPAKYSGAEKAAPGNKSDRTDEISLVKNGKINLLKKKYPIL